MDDSLELPALPPPTTSKPKPARRADQPVGKHFMTPETRRPTRKTAAFVVRPELDMRLKSLHTKLDSLTSDQKPANAKPGTGPIEDVDMVGPDLDSDVPMEDSYGDDIADDLGHDNDAKSKRSRPRAEDALKSVHAAWLSLIPSVLKDYNAYLQGAHSRTVRVKPDWSFCCPSGTCYVQTSLILCLHFDFLVSVQVSFCECTNISRRLVSNGLFPTSPSQPRVAISIDLLDFYFALFERSADAVSALASALKTFYEHRGFPVLDSKGEPVRDPFRRGLSNAIQWYDHLRRQHDSAIELAIDNCLAMVEDKLSKNAMRDATANPPERLVDAGDSVTMGPAAPSRAERQLVPGKCHRILQKRCPACFGGTRFGRDFQRDGGDIHVAMDATFSQRHNTSAGDSPWHYDAEFFISKEQVDAVGDRIASARKKGAKPFSSRVPEAALDECRKSFEAADEKKEKTTGKKFDDTGLMALVCRHDIVLFLANVDTPGEQQKFTIALLEHFFSLVPDSATVAVLYDIGCVLDRSVHSYDILPESIVRRLIFATSVMHAYGHQWSCQIVYNPRLREGLGLTEGEGTERVWSKFRKLIGVTRTSGRSRRIWLLDRHAKFVNEASRADLGFWIRNKLKHGVDAREAAAKTQLEQCGITVQELRHQWDLQQADQLSEKRHAPARVKKELDAVLGLQTELESIQQHLTAVQESITAGGDNPTSRHFLESLRKSHTQTVTKVDDLYTSLNVSEGFPELQHLPLDFVRILLMARDLKINIRKRAIGSFFEWDKLDRAAGGRDQPLGTKLHQQTWKAISKRTPALMTAIRKFNGYCDALRAMCKPGWNVSLPCHLPTELSALREDSSLLTDVWISPAETRTPRWLEDPNIRQGIRALLLQDRCREERRRLGEEADNLCRWYGRELAAVELALHHDVVFFLQQRKDELLLLQARWRTPLVSDLRFDAHTRDASAVAQEVSGIATAPPRLQWIILPFADVLDSGPWGMEEAASADVLLACDTLDELVGDNLDGPRETESPLPAAATLVIPPADNFDRILLPSKELRRLRQHTAWLSDDCINGGAQALLRHYGSSSTLGGTPSLLSTRVFSLHLDDVDDDRLWRDCSHSRYWTKDVWLLPIHRLLPSGHWTLAVIYWREGRIAYFDSMADKDVWERDVQDVFSLSYRLHRIANERVGQDIPSYEGWEAYPLVETPLQTNSYDCGVWVLACIAALLRGYHSVQLSQTDISRFRSDLLGLIVSLSQ
ncbi:hypothetical protein FKP32DRAFT_1668689 [Trametes sanguinea]|nr:hypothetical protein FKP32DRAFT_1668689 [Trametes sanguinea]